MEDLKIITFGELMFLGLQELAYIKSVRHQNRDLFKVYAADGTELATVKNELEGRALIRKNDLRLAMLH